ncbi:haloacid dehalogenase [Rhodococcus sp. 06-412-2C]|uniref:phosphonatase-like hydrolase n=1 Tax=unclassified Rhodococcus (in: high G+C Gram-positive bacteria) TaxID=192944 RepID=UPI000B9AC92F|nr:MULTISPECIES: phosphonatase-like hydrolase [unclassified Rhodococcus (in: high G+C Gram-positive bacteria)]OZC83995.1 haloacid dehalogenase [Rhodococcus sp. 06-412-2C]OZC94181.1 haloacid dehalogenase [Rhodococcus sp. 06-412-2B]
MNTPESHPISLVVFDMAGTTVEDSGLVQQSFAAADEHAGLSHDAEDKARMLAYVTDTMGQSKIEVFRHLTGGNEEQAQSANKAFERCYGQLVRDGHCSAIPGAAELLLDLRSRGVKTALTTGFAHETQHAILTALQWQDIADVVLCPGDGVRGRPFPDMPLTALLRTAAPSVQSMVVIGDTTSDITSGLRSGARAVVGVLTGAHDADQLRAAGATHILDSVAELPGLLDTLH